MKVFFSLLASLWLLFPLAAQPAFEPGFFIDQAGARISCQILIPRQEQTPQQFRYRLDEADAPQSGTMDQVQAFGVTGKSLFQRATVEVESSPRLVDQLSTSPALQKSSKEVFLETLIEGEVSLLRYRASGVENFYLLRTGESPVLLPYKRYRADGTIKEHAPFRQMLHTSYACPGTDAAKMAQLAYQENALVNHIERYLKCQGIPFVNLQNRQKGILHLSVRPGIRFTQIQLNHDYLVWSSHRVYQESPVTGAIGLELEWLPPLKNQRWALTLEPTLQSASFTSAASTEYFDYTITTTYRSIETLVGLRYYQPLSPDLQLFANLGIGYDFIFGSDFIETGGPLDTHILIQNGKESYFGGLGLTFKQRFTFESRYLFGKDFLVGVPDWSSQYHYFTAILGVRVF